MKINNIINNNNNNYHYFYIHKLNIILPGFCRGKLIYVVCILSIGRQFEGILCIEDEENLKES